MHHLMMTLDAGRCFTLKPYGMDKDLVTRTSNDDLASATLQTHAYKSWLWSHIKIIELCWGSQYPFCEASSLRLPGHVIPFLATLDIAHFDHFWHLCSPLARLSPQHRPFVLHDRHHPSESPHQVTTFPAFGGVVAPSSGYTPTSSLTHSLLSHQPG